MKHEGKTIVTAKLAKLGLKVIPGLDWKTGYSGQADGSVYGVIIDTGDLPDYVQVNWMDDKEEVTHWNSYYVTIGKYDLYLYEPYNIKEIVKNINRLKTIIK